MIHDFAGRVAVVTGAGSGMGRACAERFAAEKMRVVLADIDSSSLGRAVDDLRRTGAEAIGVVTDVAHPDSVENLARQAEQAFGKIHLVCNNAGVDGYLDGPIWQAGDAEWQWTVGVNFWSVVHGIRAFLPRLLAHGEPAHMVNTASTTGLVHASNMYGITKHAVVALSETLHAQLQQLDSTVGVSVLCPGIVHTNLFAARERPIESAPIGNALREQMRQRLANAIPPAQVADVLLRAIQTNQFYVLTDTDWDERIRARADAIQHRASPNLAVRAR